jgi:hypothetical protein
MVEVLVASALVAGGVIAATRLGGTGQLPVTAEGFADDLPCPWCQAATSENDMRCPTCYQPFG